MIAATLLRILFIGNSLTAVNDLPGMVCRLAAIGGREAVCESVVRGGFSLDDHLAEGTAMRRLLNEQWSIVVLQQGPSALPESRILLRNAVQQFDVAIRDSGARPALYAVWPDGARSFDFPRVSDSYRLAAQDVGGLFFPAGDAWLAAWKQDSSIGLYGPDQFHPSRAGTYVAALVVYGRIYGVIPATFGDRQIAERAAGGHLDVSDAQLRILFDAARRLGQRRLVAEPD